MFALASQSPPSRTCRRALRIPIALALASAALSAAGADVAAAAAPVPCTGAGSGRFNCNFYPSAGAPVQTADGRTVGTLHRGTNWVICQRVGGRVTSGPYYNNNWAWTLADNNRWGWVNAVWGQGGANNGPFGGVPGCGAAQGNPPGIGGTPTPPPPPSGGRPAFAAPWPCGQTRTYYHHSSEVHNALDFNLAGSSDLGTPAVASAGGRVVSARYNGGYGNEVVIDHGGGWTSRVAHLSRMTVRAGQSVSLRQEVGKVGSTGNSSGPHLHYEQRLHNRAQPIVIGGRALRYSAQPAEISSGSCR